MLNQGVNSMELNNIINIDREIVAKCKCSGQLWYIYVDKPDFTEIRGFQCSFCGDMIDLTIKKEEVCVLWRECKLVNTKECGEHCESYTPF